MAENVVLIRYDEIFLKGKNRPYFIGQLRKNIKNCLKKSNLDCKIDTIYQHLYIYTDKIPEVTCKLKNIFGIAALNPAVKVSSGIEILKKEALNTAVSADLNESMSFHIYTQRSDKTYPLISTEVNTIVGEYVRTRTGAGVDLSKNADLVISIKILGNHALVFKQSIPGPRGLPLGTQGKAVALMSGGIDSPVAAWLIMKRGCRIIPLHFRQSRGEYETFLKHYDVLTHYCCGYDMQPIIIEYDEILHKLQEKLQYIRAEGWTCIFCKRTMIRLACEVADKHQAGAIIMGDSLGQVASQTLNNLEVISYGSSKPILRPLIGLDKVEITRLGQSIGTFVPATCKKEAAGCPYVPHHPVTRGKMSKFLAIMEKLKTLD